MAGRNSGGSARRFLFLLFAIALVFAGLATFRVGSPPSISIEPELPGIGKRTTIGVVVEETKRGLSDVRVEFVQGERIELLAAKSYEPRKPWKFWGDRTTQDRLSVDVGSETLENLEEGTAVVRVVADRAGTWLRSPNPAVHDLELQVKLRPPSLHVLSSFTYVRQGGSETVVYNVGPATVRDGVQAGDHWFPGFALPGGGPHDRFALFGAPHDLDDQGLIQLVAVDDVGNEARAKFVDRFTLKPYRTGKIQLSETFMARVVPAIMSQTPNLEDKGNLLDNYLHINGELRRRNAEELSKLSQNTVEEFLWNRHFLQMRNAKVMSPFAARRTYMHDGKAVDQQDHLGFDLASTRAAEIQAANDGVVMLARYFGIYGNAVVLDHGYGLQSLYGHLSSISVEEGQRVARGDVVGRSGETGLAGGDHLHFTMMIQGMAVDPQEWWDPHWIHDRLVLKLGAALPFRD